ncbi:MAG: hypothetical protein Q8R55_04455 [Candidatus Taylorbacteria bacterium]|nr:hypothetical protein [Candidatus Taylorbacteria bacterium]
MSSTKIINILKNDRFEDVLEIFKNTPANEVIFVLPRKSQILNKEDHFAIVAEAAEEQGKTVLLLASDPETNALALKYNFGVLVNEKVSSKPKAKPKPKPEPVYVEPEPEALAGDDVQKMTGEVDNDEIDGEIEEAEATEEDPIQELSSYDNDLPQIEFAVATKKPSKTMSDIVVPPSPEDEESVSVKVAPKKETSFEIGVRKETAPANIKEPIDNIENVWQSRRETPGKIYAGPAPGFKLPGFPIGKWTPNLSKKLFLLYTIAVVIIFGIVLYVSMGSARIIIKPRAHTLDFILKVFVSDQFSEIDLKLRNIPGQFFSIEKRVEETFQAMGERDVAQKARGKITVYNEYGTTPQTLIATTRFESAGGLIFRTLKTITIPGTTVQNGKITAGKIEVEVIADKAGDDYNIAVGKFTIPAFKEKGDADRYQKFYGMSSEQMKGGIVGKAKVITEKDYIDAKKKIEERITSEAEQEFKDRTGGLKIFDLPSLSLGEITSTAQIDEAVDTFTLSASARLENIGFRESDLHDLIAGYVGDLNDLSVLPEKLKLEFSDIKIDKDKKILVFNVSVRGPAYSRINNDQITSELAGKNEGEIKEYIKNKEAIASAKVLLSPFWVRKVPKDLTRIKFELNYE